MEVNMLIHRALNLCFLEDVYNKQSMKHFTLNELTYSTTAQSQRIDNKPDATQVSALTALVDNLLDPLRERLGKPITVNSGFRCPALNRAVGGAKTSQHLMGEAADITAGSKEANRKLFEVIRQELDFDQLIDEKNLSWVHVSYKQAGNRKQILKL